MNEHHEQESFEQYHNAYQANGLQGKDMKGADMQVELTDRQLSTFQKLDQKITKIAQDMEKTQIASYVQLMNRPGRLIFLNLLAGTSRGVGIAIGFTIFATTIVYILRMLGALNLPIIGDYIADIVRVVQAQLEGRAF